MRITVMGEPVAKQRPRLGRGGSVYTPVETREYERAVALIARSQLPKFKEKERLTIELNFFCDKDRKDLDNLCKSTLDGLQKAGTFKNDSQIVELHATKHIKTAGERARTEINIQCFG